MSAAIVRSRGRELHKGGDVGTCQKVKNEDRLFGSCRTETFWRCASHGDAERDQAC